VCNGKDDNCNGMIDEGLAPTTCGTGACQVTQPSCVGGVPQDCTPKPPGTETCNGIDDDCNGVVDDNLGQTTCGMGACQRTVNNCVAGVPQTCTPGTPTAEICNGIDDDCNGMTDENLGSTTCGMGACMKTVSNCVGGVPQTCTPGVGSPEICNGIDDDCNGMTDENLGSTTCGMGACMRTVDNCVGGVPQTCTAGSPSPEVCNGIDDDCNGMTDENLGSTTCGMGACQRTVANCVNGMGQTCVPGAPALEICNGIDDDCNGMTDENLGSTTCGKGLCQRTVANCVGGAPQTCTPGPAVAELCNGMDDDCDGVNDNGFDVGASCTVGKGACKRTGVKVCSPDGTGTVCNATPGTPTAELCNGIDDDCDGTVDNGFDVGASCGGVGGQTCTRVKVCSQDGTTTVCSGVGMTQAEICDGLDNDCDGQVDNNFDVGAPCTVGEGACKVSGTKVCTADHRSTECNAVPGQPKPETCNGIDDDCDGQVDNGLGVGAACTVGVGACSNMMGTQACTPDGGVSCSGSPIPGMTEVCDYLDNDCNGIVDDGFDVGASCTVGVGECLRMGKKVCSADKMGTVCSAAPGVAGVEICNNGKDDDCDGIIDDGCPFLDGGAPDTGTDARDSGGGSDSASDAAASDVPTGGDGSGTTVKDGGAKDSGAVVLADAGASADTAAPTMNDAGVVTGSDGPAPPPGSSIRIVKGGGLDCTVALDCGRARPSALIGLVSLGLLLQRRLRRSRRRGTAGRRN
jgi:hypothetical protein